MNDPHEVFSIEGVQDFIAREPATPRCGYAVMQICQTADRMRVGGYDALNTAGSCGANPLRLEVETVRVAVDFDGAFGLGDGVQHLFHPASERRTRPDQSAERVTPDLEERQLERAQQPLGHLLGIHLVTRVDTRDDDIEFLEDMVGIIE